MDLLDSMKVYVLAVEKGSLSAAAKACGISATMAGNHLRMLEKHLGTQLLNRTTRRQHLTGFGENYYERCKEILRLVAEGEAQAQSLQSTPTGKLRVTAPVTFGTEALMPALSGYLDRYPDVSVDVVLCDRVVDLVEEGFEVAIRIGQLPDSGLVAKSLSPYRLMICASPSYLARRGTPMAPEDLSQHECLSFSPAALAHWRLAHGEASYRVPVSGRLPGQPRTGAARCRPAWPRHRVAASDLAGSRRPGRPPRTLVPLPRTARPSHERGLSAQPLPLP